MTAANRTCPPWATAISRAVQFTAGPEIVATPFLHLAGVESHPHPDVGQILDCGLGSLGGSYCIGGASMPQRNHRHRSRTHTHRCSRSPTGAEHHALQPGQASRQFGTPEARRTLDIREEEGRGASRCGRVGVAYRHDFGSGISMTRTVWPRVATLPPLLKVARGSISRLREQRNRKAISVTDPVLGGGALVRLWCRTQV